jgi:hypothetical protein
VITQVPPRPSPNAIKKKAQVVQGDDWAPNLAAPILQQLAEAIAALRGGKW